jgi:hypothetical protein
VAIWAKEIGVKRVGRAAVSLVERGTREGEWKVWEGSRKSMVLKKTVYQ